jgi:hypothetical protein
MAVKAANQAFPETSDDRNGRGFLVGINDMGT